MSQHFNDWSRWPTHAMILYIPCIDRRRSDSTPTATSVRSLARVASWPFAITILKLFRVPSAKWTCSCLPRAIRDTLCCNAGWISLWTSNCSIATIRPFPAPPKRESHLRWKGTMVDTKSRPSQVMVFACWVCWCLDNTGVPSRPALSLSAFSVFSVNPVCFAISYNEKGCSEKPLIDAVSVDVA